MKEIYQNNLLNISLKLDTVASSNGVFYELSKKIVEERNDCDITCLINKLNSCLDSFEDRRIKGIISSMYNTLLVFLGALKLEEIKFPVENEYPEKSLEELRSELERFVGLKSVKEKVNDLIAFHTVQLLREKNKLRNAKRTLHMAFIGNPGTGKTSVARIVGQMYKKIGLLSKGHFVEVSRTDLIAGYQGQTALKVKKIIEKSKGGVLFIDEAYSITENSNSDSYGRECLTELTKALEDYRENLVVIVAGYKKPMLQFFDSNPGLRSRFNTFIYFDDYDAEQLTSILENMCSDYDYVLSDSLKDEVFKYFSKEIVNKKDNFSNGRLARNLYDNLIMNHAKRLVQINNFLPELLTTLEKEDFAEVSSD